MCRPAACLPRVRYLTTSATPARQASIFTTRQAEVVEALRRGKANKIIAYELKMQESTVKVHVRNVMRKLKAKNRTEVVYKVNELLHQDAASLRQFERSSAVSAKLEAHGSLLKVRTLQGAMTSRLCANRRVLTTRDRQT